MRNILSTIAVISILITSQICLASSQATLNKNFVTKHPNAKLITNQSTDKPSFIYNIDAATRSDVPLEDSAVNFMRSNAKLFGIENQYLKFELTKAFSLKKGKFLKFDHSYKGVPVLNGQTNIYLNKYNNIERIYNRALDVSGVNITPTISYREAIVEAWASIYGVGTFDLTAKQLDKSLTALYIIEIGNEAHLAYAVGLPVPVITENRIAFIDAHSGELLKSYNRIVYANKVNIYEYNPGGDGTQETVERELVELTAAQDFCESGLVEAFNCIDEGETMTVNFGINVTVPMCTEKHIAELDDDGNMLYDPVLKGWPDNSSRADEFSEVHLFYHVQKIYERFQNIALHVNASEPPFENLNQVPLHCVANFEMPDINALFGGGQVSLVPFDNAFFVPKNGLIPNEYPESDSIVFGQGTTRDFSYDADVIYHEFTHAVIGTVVDPPSISFDQYGLSTDPGAINEGYADFFSATYTGDPQMAEYVGGAFESAEGGGSLRNLENTKKCPDDVVGEVHDDSEWWSASLWTLREKYKVSDTDHDDIDAAIFEALTQLPKGSDFSNGALSYTIAATTTAEVIGEWFGTDAKTFAENTFKDRGLYNCDRAVPVQSGFRQEMTQLYGKSAVRISPYVPAMLQYHANLEKPVKSIIVSFMTYAGGGMFGGSSADVDILVNQDTAITFSYTSSSVSADNDFSASFEKVSSQDNYDTYEAVLTPDVADSFEAGDWYFIMVNNGNGDSMSGTNTLYHITFEYGCMTDDDCEECNYCSSNGICTPFEKECDTDDDCTGLDVCVVDGCTATCERPEGACATGFDCGECETCDENVCKPVTSECSEDEDCDEGETCVMDDSNCSGTCEPIEADGDVVEVDGDSETGSGSEGTGSDSGCNQTSTANILLMLLMLGFVTFRKRIKL